MAGVDPRRRGVNSEVTEEEPKGTKEEVKRLRPTHVDRILEMILDGRKFKAGQCRRIKGADPDNTNRMDVIMDEVCHLRRWSL